MYCHSSTTSIVLAACIIVTRISSSLCYCSSATWITVVFIFYSLVRFYYLKPAAFDRAVAVREMFRTLILCSGESAGQGKKERSPAQSTRTWLIYEVITVIGNHAWYFNYLIYEWMRTRSKRRAVLAREVLEKLDGIYLCTDSNQAIDIVYDKIYQRPRSSAVNWTVYSVCYVYACKILYCQQFSPQVSRGMLNTLRDDQCQTTTANIWLVNSMCEKRREIGQKVHARIYYITLLCTCI